MISIVCGGGCGFGMGLESNGGRRALGVEEGLGREIRRDEERESRGVLNNMTTLQQKRIDLRT